MNSKPQLKTFSIKIKRVSQLMDLNILESWKTKKMYHKSIKFKDLMITIARKITILIFFQQVR